jgi:hypothetical protein
MAATNAVMAARSRMLQARSPGGRSAASQNRPAEATAAQEKVKDHVAREKERVR